MCAIGHKGLTNEGFYSVHILVIMRTTLTNLQAADKCTSIGSGSSRSVLLRLYMQAFVGGLAHAVQVE